MAESAGDSLHRSTPTAASKSVSPLRLHASQPTLLRTSKERLALTSRTPLLRSARTPTLHSSLRSSSVLDTVESSTKGSSHDVTAVNVQLEMQVADLSNKVQVLSQALRRSGDVEESMKKDLREKTRHLAELKGMVGDYERKMQSYLMPDLNESKTEEMQMQLSMKDKALKESGRLIQQLLKRNKELESKQSDDLIGKLQSENRRLRDLIQEMQQSMVMKSDYDHVKRKYTELEANFGKSQEMAGQYYQKLTSLTQSGVVSAPEKLMTISGELLRLAADLSQISTALRMCHDNQEVNLGLLLTIAPAKAVTDGRDPPAVACFKSLDKVKTEVAQIRSIVSEYFAEYCGRGCAQH